MSLVVPPIKQEPAAGLHALVPVKLELGAEASQVVQRDGEEEGLEAARKAASKAARKVKQREYEKNRKNRYRSRRAINPVDVEKLEKQVASLQAQIEKLKKEKCQLLHRLKDVESYVPKTPPRPRAYKRPQQG